jgi:hypothetical protein
MFLQSLVRLAEQGSSNGIRAKAILALQFLNAVQFRSILPESVDILKMKHFAALLTRNLEPLFEIPVDQLSSTVTSNYVSKVVLSYLFFLYQWTGI